jgi:hypothetical protein
MHNSGSKVTTSSLASGKRLCPGNLFRERGLILSQTIGPYIDRLLESGRAFCDSATVPIAGAVHLNPHPRAVSSHRME